MGLSGCGCDPRTGISQRRSRQPQGPGFAWKANALRHSFISYRLAKTKDIAAVALEAGNSPKMIFAHYRELCTEAEAAQWFGIVPAADVGNVVRLVS